MRDGDIDRMAWCMFFSSVVSMRMFHPGNKIGQADLQSELDFCARVADYMEVRFEDRFYSKKE